MTNDAVGREQAAFEVFETAQFREGYMPHSRGSFRAGWFARDREGRVEEPMLGLATTSELLEELDARMRHEQNDANARELGRFARAALENLPPYVLNYRTVGPHGPEVKEESKP